MLLQGLVSEEWKTGRRAMEIHTTISVSLRLCAATEKARLCCGRDTRHADRTAVRMRNGVNLLAIAAVAVGAATACCCGRT